MKISPSKLTLGTAQLGLPYGITNTLGLPSQESALNILNHAKKSGITTFDTAPAYGEAETRLGQWIHNFGSMEKDQPIIITKLPKFENNRNSSAANFVEKTIDQSLKTLKLQQIPLLLAHRAEDILNPAIYDSIISSKENGKIYSFGASVYDVDIAFELIEKTDISALQIPFSVADQRFVKSGLTSKARSKKITIFARSAFLQGVLLLSDTQIPEFLQELRIPVRMLNEIAAFNELSCANILLRSVAHHSEITSCVIGVESIVQLNTHITSYKKGPLPVHLSAEIFNLFNDISYETQNPGRWPKM
ncbi:aldo/keto reductase [Thalassospira xiamenensis]|uniref:aldo/keto reductase n=1 Tax=Thalassospira xiamenensis TaxID=220697 RepID=UPI000DED4CE4|nr:aldo/keto reductase [Thalassospira xiamenensis]RCK33554.1 hypothetical protein TH24_21115 [Thalassospira xiamenensis]